MPRIADSTVNTVEYWDGMYKREEYPTLILANVLRYASAAALQTGHTALDVGCGQAGLGRKLLELHPEVFYTGWDYSQEALRSHVIPPEREGRYRLHCGDWLAMVAVEQPHDTVYLCDFLEHLDEPGEALAMIVPLALHRMVITAPKYDVLKYKDHRGEHAWDFTEDELKALLEPYGWVSPLADANRICAVIYVDRRK